ncbi:hypothetical protein SPSIL_015130 [Sporomusa silvacetica DSM 10669]|uniref:Uncharacterized protein n=1 Tax=Sporomusa silvacetica DSM 10669 TaxID=1123289 RepID=A0ABZ3IJ46_9FIRM|nr:hypothetical protein SPSIL_09860 [Sporomusa silvacetica DSM 10669]
MEYNYVVFCGRFTRAIRPFHFIESAARYAKETNGVIYDKYGNVVILCG